MAACARCSSSPGSTTSSRSRSGSQNPINLVKATIAGLQDLRKPEEIAQLRGLSVDKVLGLGGHAPVAEAPVEVIHADADDAAETPARGGPSA